MGVDSTRSTKIAPDSLSTSYLTGSASFGISMMTLISSGGFLPVFTWSRPMVAPVVGRDAGIGPQEIGHSTRPLLRRTKPSGERMNGHGRTRGGVRPSLVGRGAGLKQYATVSIRESPHERPVRPVRPVRRRQPPACGLLEQQIGRASCRERV